MAGRLLAWYGRHVDSTGMVGPTPYWNYLDWARGWQRGTAPGADDGRPVRQRDVQQLPLQLAVRLRIRGMDKHVVAERQVTRGLRRAGLERVNVMRPDPFSVILTEVPAAGDAVLAHHFIAEQFHSFVIYSGKIVDLDEHIRFVIDALRPVQEQIGLKPVAP